MRGRLGRRLFGAMMTCGLVVAGPALAGGSGMPWEGPLQQVVQSITGPVVQAAAVVAVVIFGGLVSSTLLDTLLTPVLYWLFGEKATRRLIEPDPGVPQGAANTQEAY